MPYLNLDLDFFQHPKTKRLIGILGPGAELIPIKLWAYCGKYHAQDGMLSGYSYREVASLCEWVGDATILIQALIKVGFLDATSNANSNAKELKVHDWEEHEGHIIAFRERAKQAALKRWTKLDATSNAKNTTSIATSNAPTIPTNKKKCRVFLPDDSCYLLSKKLLDAIKENNPSHRANSFTNARVESTVQRWCQDMELLTRKDKRPTEMIEQVIEWATKNRFWKSNILSASKLREKWDTVAAQMDSETTKSENSVWNIKNGTPINLDDY